MLCIQKALLSPLKNEEVHVEHLKILFKRLKEYELIINPTKCVLGKEEVNVFGYNVKS